MVDDIYFMGGAAKAPGNTTPLAELNIYKDPESASRVIQETDPHMIGLNATNQTYAPFELIDNFAEIGGAHPKISEILDYYPHSTLERFGQTNGPVVYDSLIAVDLIGDIIDYEEHYIEIGTDGGRCRGATIIDEKQAAWDNKGPNVTVAENVDTNAYIEILRETLDTLAQEIAR